MKKVVRRGLHTYVYLLIIVTIIAVFGALTTIGASAVTFGTAPYEYDINHDGKISEDEKGLTITDIEKAIDENGNVSIPAEINGQKVLALGLPGATNHIPGAEKIGALDLSQTGVKVIEDYAFYVCPFLSISFSAENLETVGDYAFFWCKGLTSFSAPNLKTVGDHAFSQCTLPKSFSAPNLETVGDYAFYNGEVYAYKNYTAPTSFSAPNLKTVGDYAFSWCKGLTSFSAENLETVGDYAFESCERLKSFSAPNLKTVGDYAYKNCTALTSFSAPKLETVGDYAFESCESLTRITLKEGYSKGRDAFSGCGFPYGYTITYVNDKGDIVNNSFFEFIEIVL